MFLHYLLSQTDNKAFVLLPEGVAITFTVTAINVAVLFASAESAYDARGIWTGAQSYALCG